jgi:hypothetical protein
MINQYTYPFILAQAGTQHLDVIGVVATILSVIFALGALYNSMHRKKHLQELEKAEKDHSRMRFRPPSKSSLPLTVSDPEEKAVAKTPPQKAQTVKEVSTPAPKETTKIEPVLFRQVRLSGAQELTDISSEPDDETYVWE